MKRTASDVGDRAAKVARIDGHALVFPVPSVRDFLASTTSRKRFTKPVQVGGFSKYPDGRVKFDQSLLKSLRNAAPLHSDLLAGMDTYTEPHNTAPLEHVIAAALPEHRRLHDHATCSPPPLSKHHVVTYRNNLNKIMGTPYNTNSPYSMQVQRTQGCIYLNVVLSDLAPSRLPASFTQLQAAYAGRRYEELTSKTASPRGGEYCGVFSVSLGQTKLLIGAELDGIDDSGDISNLYIELKTFRALATSKDRFTFERYKLLAFWIQSYVVGVPLIRVGFRDDSFRLVKEQTFQTTGLPRYGEKYWNPTVCINFANSFLTWLAEQALDDQVVYLIEYDPRNKCIQLTPSTAPLFVSTPLVVESHDDGAPGQH
ncbi:hypothetical protein H310_11666 [Aphanomyces invadans]|uniref:Decapping nuclease n=1 Tax=Aphanomyces invadans TaxID=157072 RepID=A0A024TM30_9STRA|nr:hypothetical protein H310_11666 [Aphanomyces invadans]ETV94686.1 hypothetical protein H310_11666 [Aphanomyces invadans]|eukprot:XP_008876631.1 hypothetical protein H310_11666 [Aphanomyces invadans]